AQPEPPPPERESWERVPAAESGPASRPFSPRNLRPALRTKLRSGKAFVGACRLSLFFRRWRALAGATPTWWENKSRVHYRTPPRVSRVERRREQVAVAVQREQPRRARLGFETQRRDRRGLDPQAMKARKLHPQIMSDEDAQRRGVRDDGDVRAELVVRERLG